MNFKDARGKSSFDVFPWMEKGQVNFSILYPGVVKAFHRHQKQEDWIVCVFGNIWVQLVGEEKKEIFLEQGDTLRIPVNTWHGFSSVGGKEAGMVYLCTEKFDPSDEERSAWDSFSDWVVENK
jgi:dTDP-4-dehydrorhamnose 3,5-epimerase